VGNPTLWFANVLRNRLLRDGIEVSGEAIDIDDVLPSPDRAAATTVFTHTSRTLAEIVQPLLKDSINLYAEACLRLNVAPGTFPTNDAALDGFRARLESWGIPRDSEQLIDGSGLSRRDTVSAEALLTILRRMYVATGTSPFLTALPVAGVDGSLATRMKGTAAEGNLRAKTGTMTNIRSLAGYVTTREGEHLAVVSPGEQLRRHRRPSQRRHRSHRGKAGVVFARPAREVSAPCSRQRRATASAARAASVIARTSPARPAP
jgi:D-alanyl-D-alanine carboxypeptidase/D-alanyl-D-alanine-endopeptidase (penicillin-binding protein 4)